MRKLALLLAILISALTVSAQTGIPPFGSFSSTPFDTVNNQNLNVYFAIPLVSSAGRGMPLTLSLINNSLVWQKSNNLWVPRADAAGNPTWGWQKDFPAGGFLAFTAVTTSFKCEPGNQFFPLTTYNNYVYTDVMGTAHRASAVNFRDDPFCSIEDTGTRAAYADDASGYYIDATDPNAPIVTSNGGVKAINGNGNATDINGNYVTKTVVSSTETDWKDSVGNTALKIVYSPTQTNPTSIQYSFLDGTGAYHTITLTLSPKTIKTNFGCTGVGEYTSTGTVNLPTKLDIPTPGGTSLEYVFAYEPTPGTPGDTTGRIQTVTLPTGGTYEYDYGATNDGANCSDGTTVNMARKITNGSDSGTWNFVRNTTNLTTTVTTPVLVDTSAANDTLFTFNSNKQEISRAIYKETPGVTTLRTISTTWATNGTPATQTTLLEDSATKAETDTSFDSNGNLLTFTEYDWGSGAHGSAAPIRTTTLSYLATAPYTSRNILNLVSEKQITDSTGTLQYRQDIAYDGSSLSCTTGALQHDDADYPCATLYRGDPTSVTTYTNAAAGSGAITKSFTYDWFGNLLTAQVNCCQLKTWAYTSTTQFSQPDSVTSGVSAPQLMSTATYDLFTGWIVTSTDANGQVTHYGYDFLRRPTSEQRPDGTILTTTYDDVNFTTTTTVPTDIGTSVNQVIALDKLGRATQSSIEDGSSTVYSIVSTDFDLIGRAYATSNPYTGSSTSYWTTTTLDALGRPTQIKAPSPDASQTSYSYSVNTVTVTDPTGKQRKSQLDAAGHLVSVWEPDSANGLNVQTTYAYTVLDNLAIVHSGSQTRTYGHDGLGRTTSVATPETNNTAVQYQYNNYDMVSQRTDARGVITAYSYDTLNRLHQVTYNVGSTGVAATPSVTLTYGTNSSLNNLGRLVSITDGVGSEAYTYDILGRLTQLQKVISGTTYTTGYSYNVASELKQVTYPSGRVVQQSFDAIGRLCAVAQTSTACATNTNPYATGYNYNNAAMQLLGFNYGNGVAATFGYSADRLQLNSLKYAKGATTLFSLSYSYGAAGINNSQIISITDNVDNGRSVTYAYDNLARLKTAVTTGSTGYPHWGLSFTYDQYGNRTAQTVTAGTAPSNSVSVSGTTNRITTSGYAYDANGNMTNDGSNTLTYDGENHLLTSSGGLGSGTYTYDGNGSRVKKLSGTTTTIYVFSGSKVIAEYVNGAAPSSPTREYIYGGSALLAKIEGSTTSYYHPDHLSVREISDSAGNLAGQQGHYPFGESWYVSGTTTKWQFTTYERDAESGTDYAMARYHVNRLARFSAPDLLSGSIADPQTLNIYAYVRNYPVGLVDPQGECPWHVLIVKGKVICTEALGQGQHGFDDSGTSYFVDGVPVDAQTAQLVMNIGFGVICNLDDCSPNHVSAQAGNGSLIQVLHASVTSSGNSNPNQHIYIFVYQYTTINDTPPSSTLSFSIFGPWVKFATQNVAGGGKPFKVSPSPKLRPMKELPKTIDELRPNGLKWQELWEALGDFLDYSPEVFLPMVIFQPCLPVCPEGPNGPA